MNIHPITRASVFALVLVGASGCGENGTSVFATAPRRTAEIAATSNLVTPPFDPRHFVEGVNNPYFPLPRGKIYTYRNLLKDTQELNTVEVTSANKTILGVAVTVVHDQVFVADGSLGEDTFDWYAQDRDGNVWYFGEDTKTYDHGTLVTTEGSWQAGENGAKAGIIMLAHPNVGDVYKQEDAPGVVADMAKVISLDEAVSVPYGNFSNCLETTEWTPIEPGDRSHKFYARGIGIVLETSTRQGGERDELTAIQ
jgi:hypothetical protein